MRPRPQRPPAPTRRLVLAGGLSGVAAALAACSSGAKPARTATPLPALPSLAPVAGVGDDAFSLGVASGDPLPDGVMLWTRLAPRPTAGGGMPAVAVPVQWEVATNERFAQVVRRGQTSATPRFGHSVHVDVRGLAPAREYFYRFRASTGTSPVGRTRTAAAATANVQRLRLAVVNCQDFQNGYWPAYAGVAKEDLDLVLHVGDYIYEYDPDSVYPDRQHTTPQTPGLDQLQTLADYRDRYGQYKSDPSLQAAHAAFPWVLTWDDHEVENNYAGLVDEIDDTGARHQDTAQFARQRAAAYQAYYEHQPIRVSYTAGSADLRLYRSFEFGDLVSMSVMDTRQYRTDQPCGRPSDLGPVSCGDDNTAGTMAGATQEQWLYDRLDRSTARWNVIAQQTMMAQLHFSLGGPLLANLDQNDGYVPYRTRLLGHVRDSRATNPVVLSGDIHSAWVSDLRVDFDKPDTPVVAAEFVSTSVSSSFFLPAGTDNTFIRAQNAQHNPHIRYFRGDKRGYTRIEVTPARMTTDLRIAQTIALRDAPVTTDVTYTVENGRPGATG